MDSEKQKKLTAIAALTENFGKQMSPDLMRIWIKMLEPYQAKQVEIAVLQVMAEYEYKTLPPFAVLKNHLDKNAGIVPAEKQISIQAEAEWGKLQEAIQSLGSYYGPPQDLHPTTAYVIRNMGGWQTVCMWQIDKLEWNHKEFIKKWELAYGNEEIMELGASHIALGKGTPQPVAALLDGLGLLRSEKSVKPQECLE